MLTTVIVGIALAAPKQIGKKMPYSWDEIPRVCSDFLVGEVGEHYANMPKDLINNMFTVQDTPSLDPETNTYRFERRFWYNPRPAYADHLRVECTWTPGGNITISYEEPSPIDRPEDYSGQESRISDIKVFSPDGKILDQEVRLLSFGDGTQPLFALAEDLRAGKYKTPRHDSKDGYITGSLGSDLTDVDPETGLFILEYARRITNNHVHLFATFRSEGMQNGLERRVLESFSGDEVQQHRERQENFHLLYLTDAKGNIVHIEREDYAFTGTARSAFGVEKVRVTTRDVTYTRYQGNVVFDKEQVTRRDLKNGECQQIERQYHYNDLNPLDETPFYWMTGTILDCSETKNKKKPKPRSFTTETQDFNADLHRLNAVYEIDQLRTIFHVKYY